MCLQLTFKRKHAGSTDQQKLCPLKARNYVRMADNLCVSLKHLLTPFGQTLEIRAVSSRISAVRCR